MLNFLIFIVVFAISTFLLAVSVRYGMIGAQRMENWLTQKSGRSFDGFDWYYRIPSAIGLIPEFFYNLVLSDEAYFKTKWWALKTSSFISVLLFIAVLKSRSGVASYYSFTFLQNKGFLAYFTSGSFVWFLNFITLMYVALAVLVTIESIRAAGWYAPIRIAYYGLLCFLMGSLTISVLSGIVAIAIIYIIFKLISFFFFSSRRRRKQRDEETAGSILSKGLGEFKVELEEWESERKTRPRTQNIKKNTPKRKPIIRRRKPVIKKEKEPEIDDDIPRLHPD